MMQNRKYSDSFKGLPGSLKELMGGIMGASKDSREGLWTIRKVSSWRSGIFRKLRSKYLLKTSEAPLNTPKFSEFLLHANPLKPFSNPLESPEKFRNPLKFFEPPRNIHAIM